MWTSCERRGRGPWTISWLIPRCFRHESYRSKHQSTLHATSDLHPARVFATLCFNWMMTSSDLSAGRRRPPCKNCPMTIRHFCTVETADSLRYTQRICGVITVTRRSLLWAGPGVIQLRCRLHLGMTNADLDRNRSDRLPEDSFRSACKGKI